MGHTASIPTPVFSLAKEEYESKKNELSDADLFNHMKAFIDQKTSEQASVETEVTAAPIVVSTSDAPTEILAAAVETAEKAEGEASAPPAAEVEIPAGEVQTEVTAAL